ncbi:MAG TPA: anhydro-N-acetylmuramic acid kinase [Chloroflexia bacterium]|nr:anhydro-N-acetylmuramic acid kinase [Chloroflexia bacterium]
MEANQKISALVAGLMSGTSVDGVDVALCRFEESLDRPGEIEFELLHYSEEPHPLEIKAQVFEAFREEAGPAELCELNFALGEVFAAATLNSLRAGGFSPAQLDLVASHGQTIYHQVAAGRRKSTLQMAEAAVIAERTGVTTAYDFRTADMTAGGQGAPLVPYFDLLFFTHPTRYRALQNIGGIGNVTFIPAGAAPDKVLAFDTGPGNSLIDHAARYFSHGELQYDKNGEMARGGNIHPGWLDELLSHPYFEAPAPKSTGRELFGDAYCDNAIRRASELGLSPADTMATLTAFTAKSIALGIRRFKPEGRLDELIVSGGGARNPVLMEMLAEWLPGVEVAHHDKFGIKAEAKEAVAFALMGYELLRNRPANVPACTGATRPVLLGKLAPGRNYFSLLQKFVPAMQPDFQNRTKPYEPNLEEDSRWQRMPRLIIRPA